MVEVYAPRAALYETLPDLLHRLMGPTRNCLASPDPPQSSGVPVSIRFSGGRVAYEATRSTVGAEYVLDRRIVEGGLNLPLSKELYGWASMRHVIGSADVSAPTGGGQIDATGTGPTFGVSWRGKSDFYAVACGSVTNYNIDFISGLRGLLEEGVDGDGHSLSTELGRRFELDGNLTLIPRAWLVRTRVSVDDFSDAVESRVSFPEADRMIGGLGTVAELVQPWRGGEFSLRGSLDMWWVLRGVETAAWVSGERLSSESPENGILLGLDGLYRRNRFSVGATLSMGSAFGSNTREYSGFIRFGIHL